MQKKTRSNQARRAKAIKRRFQIFGIIALLLGAAAVIFFAPFFNINEAYVVRSDIDCEYKISDEEVLAASGIVIGKNIFATDISKVKASIMSLPYAQKVDVQRVFPNKIKIILGEAARAACVQCESGFALINMDGRILEIAENADEYEVPHLLGFDIVGAEVGQAVPLDGNPIFAAALNILELLDNAELLGRTNSINTADLNNIEILIGDRVQILISNEADLEYRIKFIKKVMDEKLSPYESVTLDYRAADLSVRSYKPKPSESPDSGDNGGNNDGNSGGEEEENGTDEKEL